MKKIFLPFFCILLMQHSFAQKQGQELIDSLSSELTKAKEDTNKVKILIALSKGTFNMGEYTKELGYVNTALSLSKKLFYNKGEAAAHNLIGNMYNMQGNYPVALKNYLSALKINEATGDKKGMAANYNNIGLIYMNTENYSEALKNLSLALRMYQELGDRKGMNHPYNNMGSIYYYQHNYPEALKNYIAALEIRKEMGDDHEIAISYGNIGLINHEQGNYTEALNYYLKGLKIQNEIGDKDGIASSYEYIGSIYIKLKDYNKAREYFNDALDLNKEVGNVSGISESYSGLSALDSLTGNYKSSLANYQQYITYRDSLINEDNTKKLVQQQMQYDFDKKEAAAKAEQEKKDAVALKELQKQKLVRNGFVGGFAVVLLFAGVFFTQRNKIKKGKKRSDELLLNILPEEVAEELKEKGSADAKQFDEVTVMFTDFKGFTQISEKLSPTELVNEIHECFKAFDNIISKHNIEKIKTIGDSYMCAGGLPVANKTNATDVVKAALEIQQLMNDQAPPNLPGGEESQRAGQGSLSGRFRGAVRIGIHTGPVVAGIVGVKKFAYDIWGDTVNIASRMESSGEEGKVNISGATYELVKDKFNCTHRGKIQAKNKGEIDMFFVEQVF